jgi:hypothetical protein
VDASLHTSSATCFTLTSDFCTLQELRGLELTATNEELDCMQAT